MKKSDRLLCLFGNHITTVKNAPRPVRYAIPCAIVSMGYSGLFSSNFFTQGLNVQSPHRLNPANWMNPKKAIPNKWRTLKLPVIPSARTLTIPNAPNSPSISFGFILLLGFSFKRWVVVTENQV